jgi:uncharacterized protein (TIGR02391 family)
MIDRYIQINRALRSIAYRARDGEDVERVSDDSYATGTIADYILRDVSDLERLWPPDLTKSSLWRVSELAQKRDGASFRMIFEKVVPDAENTIDDFFAKQPQGDLKMNILDFLHPVVIDSAYSQFRNGHLRDAVFNAFVAVFDLLRRRTGIDKDGADLVGEALSLVAPKLVLSTLQNESGKNDQKGFLQILQGAFQGVRNPKAHSLESDLDQASAAEYLIFASLLARRISEASIPS